MTASAKTGSAAGLAGRDERRALAAVAGVPVDMKAINTGRKSAPRPHRLSVLPPLPDADNTVLLTAGVSAAFDRWRLCRVRGAASRPPTRFSNDELTR